MTKENFVLEHSLDVVTHLELRTHLGITYLDQLKDILELPEKHLELQDFKLVHLDPAIWINHVP